MKIILVQNSARYPTLLEQAFEPHDTTVLKWNELPVQFPEDTDAVILSGSSQFPVAGNEKRLRRELDLIQKSTAPLLGICYGFELITIAFGGTLKRLPEKEQGVSHMKILINDPIFDTVDDLFVYEGHHWAVDTLPEVLVPLAKSPHGIEAVKHASRAIYGFQFHPEKLASETAGGKIIKNFLTVASSPGRPPK